MQDALITLTGNIGTDVEFTQGAGWSLARFRLACTPRRLREGTWVDQETTWVNVSAWGRTAENMRASLAKGDPVLVHGKLRTSAWQGADGLRHERLVVEAMAIGHDLSRGCSEFTRPVRQTVPDPAGPGRIDVATGECLDGAPAAGPTDQPGDGQLANGRPADEPTVQLAGV